MFVCMSFCAFGLWTLQSLIDYIVGASMTRPIFPKSDQLPNYRRKGYATNALL